MWTSATLKLLSLACLFAFPLDFAERIEFTPLRKGLRTDLGGCLRLDGVQGALFVPQCLTFTFKATFTSDYGPVARARPVGASKGGTPICDIYGNGSESGDIPAAEGARAVQQQAIYPNLGGETRNVRVLGSDTYCFFSDPCASSTRFLHFPQRGMNIGTRDW